MRRIVVQSISTRGVLSQQINNIKTVCDRMVDWWLDVVVGVEYLA